MADPSKYTRNYNFSTATLSDFKSNINPEFDELVTVADEIVEAIKDVRRSDGALKNDIVTADSLNASVTATLDAAVADAESARDAAQTARDAAQTAQANAETAETGAQTAQTAAEAAQTAAETAQTNAETAETGAQTAQTRAELAETNAQGHAGDAAAYATAASNQADAAESSAQAAAEAVAEAPNDVATTVFTNGRDFGSVVESAPFLNEETPAVRVDLAKGTASIDLGGVI